MIKIFKIIIFIIAGLTGLFTIIFALFLSEGNEKEIWISVLMSIFFTCCGFFFDKFKKLCNRIREKFKRPYIYKQDFLNRKVRLSFAYLIRIKTNSHYLLIKHPNHNRFQPVGGVYYQECSEYLLRKFGFQRDNKPGDPKDIRGNIEGKNVSKFIRWFDKKKNREITPYREFKEELINEEIFPNELFNNPNIVFRKTFYRGVSWSDYYNTLELMRFDIYELIPSSEQLEFLRKLKSNKKIYLANEDEMKTMGITPNNDKQKFGTQTKYILEDYKDE